MSAGIKLNILKILSNIDKKGMANEVILGAILKGISSKKDEDKPITITQLNIKEIIGKLINLSPIFYSSCENKFREYMQEAHDKYVTIKPVVEQKELKTFNDFKEKFKDFIQIKESDILNYFDSIFSKDEKNIGHGELHYNIILKDGSIIPGVLLSNKVTLDKITEFNKILDPKIYINSYYFSNLLSFYIYCSQNFSSVDDFLNNDLAETSAKGYMLSQAANTIRDYMDKNLEEMFSNFF